MIDKPKSDTTGASQFVGFIDELPLRQRGAGIAASRSKINAVQTSIISGSKATQWGRGEKWARYYPNHN